MDCETTMMEFVSKSWEDSSLLIGFSSEECINGTDCKGVTARTVHLAAFGRPLNAYTLPSGRKFPFCLLCLRAETSKVWYEVLYRGSFPEKPIHEWAVRVDEPGEYDAAVCIGPPDVSPISKKSKYCGVVAPFPRYDETILLVVPNGFKQIGVDYVTIPRLLTCPTRCGARPLGFYDLYRTQFALIHAGYVCAVNKDGLDRLPVAETFARCLPKNHYAASNSKWYETAGHSLEMWMKGIKRTGALGLYPHCKVKLISYDESTMWDTKHIIFFVREHVTFLIERDSKELRDAVIRAYPEWPKFETDVRTICDSLREKGIDTKKIVLGIKFQEPVSLLSACRSANFDCLPFENRSVVSEMLVKHEIQRINTIKSISSMMVSDADIARSALFYYAVQDKFKTTPIVVDKNRTPNPIEWYVCSCCGEFKSDTKRDGCLNVCLDLDTNEIKCHKRKTSGKKPIKGDAKSFEVFQCEGIVFPIPFGVNIVNIDFYAFVACSRCQRSCIPHDWIRTIYGYTCDECRAVKTVSECEVCGVRCTKEGFKIRTFVSGAGAKDVWFCRSHARQRLKTHAEIWNYDLMMGYLVECKRTKR